MRHSKSFRQLGRKAHHRKALLRNLVTNLIEYEKIRTTLANAKELKRVAEKTITDAKKDDFNTRRKISAVITKKEVIKKLFDTIAKRYADRPGGYTRVIQLGTRRGDAAQMALIELV